MRLLDAVKPYAIKPSAASTAATSRMIVVTAPTLFVGGGGDGGITGAAVGAVGGGVGCADVGADVGGGMGYTRRLLDDRVMTASCKGLETTLHEGESHALVTSGTTHTEHLGSAQSRSALMDAVFACAVARVRGVCARARGGRGSVVRRQWR
jgi:hypothetical protein